MRQRRRTCVRITEQEPHPTAALRVTFLAAILVAVIAPAGCGSDRESTGPPVDWDAMFVNGRTSTVAEAKREMGFEVLVPSLLGEPARVVITSPDSSPPRFRLTGFIYEDPTHGLYWVIEEVSQTSQGELESLTECDPAAGCEGSWTIAELPRGIRGVLVEGPIATSVMWLEGVRRFDVVGPRKQFDGSFATEVASDVVLSEP
jgi:hypothetical protein